MSLLFRLRPQQLFQQPRSTVNTSLFAQQSPDRAQQMPFVFKTRLGSSIRAMAPPRRTWLLLPTDNSTKTCSRAGTRASSIIEIRQHRLLVSLLPNLPSKRAPHNSYNNFHNVHLMYCLLLLQSLKDLCKCITSINQTYPKACFLQFTLVRRWLRHPALLFHAFGSIRFEQALYCPALLEPLLAREFLQQHHNAVCPDQSPECSRPLAFDLHSPPSTEPVDMPKPVISHMNLVPIRLSCQRYS